MCDICSEYGVQTVRVRENRKEIQVCFRCMDENNNVRIESLDVLKAMRQVKEIEGEGNK